MKFIIFCLIVVSGLNAFSQSFEAEYKALIAPSFGNQFEQKLQRTEQILAAATKLAADKNIQVTKIILQNKKGQSYPALQILPGDSSAQNQEATRVAEQLYALPLILSPLDLSSGTNAFFDPNGSKLGVPYAFILNDGQLNESYQHELYHANTYLKVMSGQSSFWAGLVTVNKGHFISPQNRNYYFRYVAADEIVATALSLKLEIARLKYLFETQNKKDFFHQNGEAKHLLDSIYFSTVVGRTLAKQQADIAARAKITLPIRQQKLLTLGLKTQEVAETIFKIDSYTWEIVGGKGTAVPVAQDATYSMYSLNAYTDDELNDKLLKMQTLSFEAEALFKTIESRIYVLIEYPDLSKTDVKSLVESLQPYDLLSGATAF